MRSSVLIFAAFAAHAVAQEYNYTFPSGFDLGDVSTSDLNSWCQGERNTCPEVCGGAAESNTCDSTTLDFSCVCDNGTTPDLSPYVNTIPFYVCEANYAQCINNNPNDLSAQDSCKANATCGTVTAGASSTTSSSSSSASSTSSSSSLATTASASATGSSTGSATGASATATSSTGAAVLQIAQDHSTGFFAAALLAVFGMLL